MTTMTARDAARRMGVKVETLYAYVSRGILTRQAAADGRSSVFDVREIEALARRGRPRRSSRSTSLDLLIETHLTELSPRGVRYRGHLAAELATTCTFEQVAELLWLGAVPGRHVPWAGDTVTVPAGLDLVNAIAVIVSMVAAGEDAAGERNAAQVAAAGRRLIASVVDSLPPAGGLRVPRLARGGRPLPATVAGRLWTRLSARRPPPHMLGVLDTTLILLADHDLAASTLAVRVAASTRAAPAATILAGLGVLRGPLHGGASTGARALLARAAEHGARRAVDDVVRGGRRVPGFGHKVYADTDPRADALLQQLARAAPRVEQVTAEVSTLVRERTGQAPNVDLALAAFTWANDLPADAGHAVMATARMAGWLAHAMEEYTEAPLRFRPRALYVT